SDVVVEGIGRGFPVVVVVMRWPEWSGFEPSGHPTRRVASGVAGGVVAEGGGADRGTEVVVAVGAAPQHDAGADGAVPPAVQCLAAVVVSAQPDQPVG